MSIASTVLAAVALVAGAAILGGCGNDLTDTTTIALGGHTLTVEVADSLSEQMRGLQDHREPGDNEGVLFVWDDAQPRAFTIGSVDYEIDILFVGEDRVVNEVLALSPDGPTRVQGMHASQWAIEVRGGWADDYEIGVGDRLLLDEGW